MHMKEAGLNEEDDEERLKYSPQTTDRTLKLSTGEAMRERTLGSPMHYEGLRPKKEWREPEDDDGSN